MEKIIATVGPSLLNKHPISELYSDDLIFNVTGTWKHISITEYINRIRKEKRCIDPHGFAEIKSEQIILWNL